jgi:hypothetical protein
MEKQHELLVEDLGNLPNQRVNIKTDLQTISDL